MKTKVINKAIKLANELRSEIWKNRGFPVDPVIIANNLGIKVVETNLPEIVSSVLMKEKGKDLTIIVHYIDSKNRKRFLSAYELGHFIYHFQQNKDNDKYEYINFRNKLNIQNREIFANNFAINLLMPDKEIKKLNRKGTNVIIMAYFFDVPVDIVNFRLKGD